MKKLVIVLEEKNQHLYDSLAGQIKEAAKELDMETVYFLQQDNEKSQTHGKLSEIDADYLVSFDMAGFEISTLTEGSAYNLLYAKQIHILFQNDWKYQRFLQQDLAMNLFLFVGDEYLFKKYKQEYPHILNLEAMQPLYLGEKLTEEQQEKNGEAIRWVLKKVYNEIETAGILKDRLFETSPLCALDK
ncbi:MAG: hypothetical protein HDR01_14985 [Lachnospiraceae bacterium]|nr:hypothetical protein [Lachnospiraceae bacterium]